MRGALKGLALGTLLLASASPASAQGVPTIDSATVAQLTAQLEQMLQTYEAELEQLGQLEEQLTTQLRQLESMTGSFGISGIMNSPRDEQARAAADSLAEIIEASLSRGSLPSAAWQIQDLLEDLWETYDVEALDLQSLASSEEPLERAIAAEAGSAMGTSAVGEDGWRRSEAALDRIEGLIAGIDSQTELKAAIDYQTRVLAELGVILVEQLRVQAAMASHQGAVSMQQARDAAVARRFGRWNPEESE